MIMKRVHSHNDIIQNNSDDTVENNDDDNIKYIGVDV